MDQRPRVGGYLGEPVPIVVSRKGRSGNHPKSFKVTVEWLWLNKRHVTFRRHTLGTIPGGICMVHSKVCYIAVLCTQDLV